MKSKVLRIGLAALKNAPTIVERMEKIEWSLKLSSQKNVEILCFPEAYLPGLRMPGISLPSPDQSKQERELETIRQWAKQYSCAVIIGMEWVTRKGLLNLAFVISAQGRILGYQTKNQITPKTEALYYVPDYQRRLFTIAGIKIGVVICHEGWRYPETVRWAAVRGARIVFQPQSTGCDIDGIRLKKWGESFYEKAMQCRSQENTIYFASVNNAMRFQNSATSLMAPNGTCQAYIPYGKEDVMIQDVDLSLATRYYAKRYDPRFYPA